MMNYIISDIPCPFRRIYIENYDVSPVTTGFGFFLIILPYKYNPSSLIGLG